MSIRKSTIMSSSSSLSIIITRLVQISKLSKDKNNTVGGRLLHALAANCAKTRTLTMPRILLMRRQRLSNSSKSMLLNQKLIMTLWRRNVMMTRMKMQMKKKKRVMKKMKIMKMTNNLCMATTLFKLIKKVSKLMI